MAIAWVAVGVWTAHDEGMSVAFERTQTHFGQLSPGESLQCSFKFANREDGPIWVVRVQASCGCIVSSSSGKRVQPGDSGVVTATLNTKGMHPPTELRKPILVQFTDGRSTQDVRLLLEASLRADVVIEPHKVELPPPASPNSGFVRSKISIHREMLGASAFAELRVVPVAPYCRIEEKRRTSEILEVEVELQCAKAPAYPRPVAVQYAKAGRPEVIRIPVVRRENSTGIAVVPSSYVVTVSRTSDSAALREETIRSVRLTSPTDGHPVITDVKAPARVSDTIFAWQYTPTEPDRLNIWVERLPEKDGVVATELVVSYRDEHLPTEGQTSIRAYIVIVPGPTHP